MLSSLRKFASDNDWRNTGGREERDVESTGASEVIDAEKLGGDKPEFWEKQSIARPTERVLGNNPKRRRQRNGANIIGQTHSAAAGPIECSRNVTFIIEQSGSSNYRLVISSPVTGGNSVEYTSTGLNYNRRYDELHKDSTRKFIVTFPPPPLSASPRVKRGNTWALAEYRPTVYFHVEFLDVKKKLVWPTFVQELWDPVPTLSTASTTESIPCPIYTSPQDIQILRPVLKHKKCENLIENGGQDFPKKRLAERDGAEATSLLAPWHHNGGGVAVDPTRGINGSGMQFFCNTFTSLYVLLYIFSIDWSFSKHKIMLLSPCNIAGLFLSPQNFMTQKLRSSQRIEIIDGRVLVKI